MSSHWLDNLRWLGHASFIVAGPKIIYFDPWKVQAGMSAADLIFISHSHYDHLSPVDVAKIQKPETKILAPADVLAKLSGNLIEVQPNEEKEVDGVAVFFTPAYNITKPYHPKENHWVGYIVTVDNVRIYHAGDTDRIDEMKNIPCDVALLPVGGTYTMDFAEAAQAAADINPKIAVPMHYGDIVGTPQDGEKFVKSCKIPSKVLAKYQI